MKTKDAKEMFLMFADAYPNMIIGENTVKLWQEILHKIDSESFKKYCMNHIKTSSRYPTIADIFNQWQNDSGADPCKDKPGD